MNNKHLSWNKVINNNFIIASRAYFLQSEMGSLYENKVWTLVDLPDDRKAIENKWIFKKKTDADGNVTVYKARLVAKGFRQVQGVDYDETFSPVAILKSVRTMLAIAAFYDYEIEGNMP